ncbi:Uncharacterized protein APZ42_000498, partial [Daphnia magna]
IRIQEYKNKKLVLLHLHHICGRRFLFEHVIFIDNKNTGFVIVFFCLSPLRLCV